jgi:hypothetical protein
VIPLAATVARSALTVDAKSKTYSAKSSDLLGSKRAMNSMQPASRQGSSTEKSGLTRHLDTIAWAAFFIWIGIAMLVAIPWGWFLVGLGILILAMQLTRLQMNIKIEGFWVAYGAVFLTGGLWTVLNLSSWPLAPIVLILLGAVLLSKAIISIRR